MMKMILNGKNNEVIDISSYSRTLAVEDPMVRFRINLVFYGNYSAEGFEYLANYANDTITSIYIEGEDEEVILNSDGIVGKLDSLNENCDGAGRNGYATITVLEPVVEQE